MNTPQRFNPFFRPARVDENDYRAPGVPQKIAMGIPHGQLIPRELCITAEVVMVSAPRSAAAERFRRLKALLSNDPQNSPQVIVVTSPLPGEGKSLISLNLALAFAADLDGEVLLIDADVRRPGINRWLKPPPRIGLKEVLTGEAELEHGLLEIKAQHVVLLTAGAPPQDPVPLLSGSRARSLVEELRKRFRKIVIDTPPIVPFTDADIVGALSDGVLMVARSKSTPKPLLDQAIEHVTSTRILGLVLNDATNTLVDRNRHYDDYYSTYYHRRGD